MYTLDTNAIIYYTKDDAGAVEHLERLMAAQVLQISTITEIELFSQKNLKQDEQDRIELFLRYVWIIPPDSRIARIAARLRREQNLKLADATIAATALAYNTTLVTRNLRDFKRVPGLTVEAI